MRAYNSFIGVFLINYYHLSVWVVSLGLFLIWTIYELSFETASDLHRSYRWCKCLMFVVNVFSCLSVGLAGERCGMVCVCLQPQCQRRPLEGQLCHQPSFCTGRHGKRWDWKWMNVMCIPGFLSRSCHVPLAPGFRTPLGTWVVSGLHCLPLWLYMRHKGLLTHWLQLPVWIQGLGTFLLVTGRLLALSVEVEISSRRNSIYWSQCNSTEHLLGCFFSADVVYMDAC